MLGTKAVGVSLPGAFVSAAGCVHEQELTANAKPESGTRGTIAPVEIVQVEAVERPRVEWNGVECRAARGEKYAVQHDDVAGDRGRIEDVDLPGGSVRRAVRDPAAQIRMSVQPTAGPSRRVLPTTPTASNARNWRDRRAAKSGASTSTSSCDSMTISARLPATASL